MELSDVVTAHSLHTVNHISWNTGTLYYITMIMYSNCAIILRYCVCMFFKIQVD